LDTQKVKPEPGLNAVGLSQTPGCKPFLPPALLSVVFPDKPDPALDGTSYTLDRYHTSRDRSLTVISLVVANQDLPCPHF